MKLVINRCFGGFSISLECARWMAKRGHPAAMAEVDEYDAKVRDPSARSDHEKRYGPKWYGYGYTDDGDGKGYDRSDRLLVAAVEALGNAANGEHASLRVVEIPDGVDWEISEYDGSEHVAEKHRTWP